MPYPVGSGPCRGSPAAPGRGWPILRNGRQHASRAFATAGSFKAAYERNQTEAVESLLEDDILAVALQKVRLPCEGSASELLQQLNATTDHAHINAKDWPKDAKALSRRLRRLAPLLRAKGVNAKKLERTSAKRGWTLTPVNAAEGSPDLSSRSSSPNAADQTGGDDSCAVQGPIVTRNSMTINKSDDSDMNDDKSADPSVRLCATPVMSDIEAAYEELRIRDGTADPPARPLRERKRIHRAAEE